ncbi:MAG TPA: hypothetical protein VFW33_05645 [Gemmataceae bacterium]|nr:hypothetical protein [Gemmataceae bacterium]
MNPYAATLLVASLVVPAEPAPKDDDTKQLQGLWRVAAKEGDGQTLFTLKREKP